MKSKAYLPLLTVAISLALIGGVASHMILLAQSAQAQQAIPPGEGKLQKWEYCSLTVEPNAASLKGKDAKGVAYAKICYFQDSGCRDERIKAQGRREDFHAIYEDVHARAIAKLGEEK